MRQRMAQLLAAADDDQWSWAIRLAEQTGIPALGGYVRWRQLLESKDRLPFPAYAAFLPGGDWPSAAALQARGEDALGPEVTVAERLDFFANRAPRSRQGRILYAEALLAVGREQEAAALLRASWVEDDFSDDEEAQFLERYGSMLRGSDDAARVDRLLWIGARTRRGGCWRGSLARHGQWPRRG